ncbi:inositol monophosphatase family protein [Amantichitinum ursilacus]|uniref:Histidinol-phosphatase n=1 Tax=Amantichitinum ursilacus TaxID=857265 RepID=A0A0N0XIG0_9NEIS|nr:inositol monophosphatase family protein [Amantichitinum ursilacus]KPC52680.1 Histidinol-phosphatase [Amantichitinum ursilacus]
MTLPSDILHLAHELADLSGEMIKRYYRQPFAIDEKADDSPVTIADREAERVMRERINAARPQDGIIGEEHGEENTDAEWVWVLDPIDGTKSFTVGRPLFVTLIGLLHFGKPVLGVINQPITADRWIGGEGVPTTLNGQPVRVSAVDTISAARIGTTGPEYLTNALGVFNQLVAQCRYPIYGGDGFLYAQLASGWLDVVAEEGLKLHDFAALAPVIIGAGGVMTDWQGQPLVLGSAGCVLAAATPALHASLLPAFARLPL